MDHTFPYPILLAQAQSPSTPAEVHAQEAAHPAPTAAQGGETHSGTEAAGHKEAFPPFDPTHFGSQLLWLAITFAILYAVVSRVALPQIGGIIETRKARIDADLAAADASRQRTDAAIAAYEAALSEARRKAQAMAEETRTGIKADIEARRGSVEADLSRRVAEAEGRIEATKTEALGHIDEIAADTVAALVGQLTGPVSPQEARAAVAAVNREPA